MSFRSFFTFQVQLSIVWWGIWYVLYPQQTYFQVNLLCVGIGCMLCWISYFDSQQQILYFLYWKFSFHFLKYLKYCIVSQNLILTIAFCLKVKLIGFNKINKVFDIRKNYSIYVFSALSSFASTFLITEYSVGKFDDINSEGKNKSPYPSPLRNIKLFFSKTSRLCCIVL